jgi:hypothetical protein
MSVVADRSDRIAVTVTPTQARHIATAIRLDLAARWEKEWLHPLARPEEVNMARSLLDVCADELAMLHWGEPTGDVDLRSERRRLGEIAQNLLEGGEECYACREDGSTAPPVVQRQGEEMIAAALVIHQALAAA